MKTSELKTKTTEELQKLLITLRENLRSFRFKHSQRELKDTTQIRKTRKDIARVMTVFKTMSESRRTT